MVLLFYISLIIIIYHIFLFPLLLYLLILIKKSQNYSLDYDIELPTVTILTAAYNEEDKIRDKLDSFCRLNYPKHLIKLHIISDKSTDNTEEIVREYMVRQDNIFLTVMPTRSGKAGALNYIEPEVSSEIIVSSDASSILANDSIRKLVRHFKNDKIGLVSGRLIYIKRNNAQSGEGLYWKYESLIRKLESNFYSIICASGCLFAIRRELYSKIHPSSPDDFERTLAVLKNRYIARLETEAVVEEYITGKSHEEISRKVRIISREWFALMRNKMLINPLKFPKVAFILISHKLIRWMLFLFNISIFISLIFLMQYQIYKILLISYVILHLIGIVGIIVEKFGKSIPVVKLFGYYVAMNYASLIAFIKFICGKQQKTWNTE